MQRMHFGNGSADILHAANGKLLQDTNCIPSKNSTPCYDQEWYAQVSSSKGRYKIRSQSMQPHCPTHSLKAGKKGTRYQPTGLTELCTR